MWYTAITRMSGIVKWNKSRN